jgi:peptidoglycan/xylan/chitin deacetylase (PgdA/CDA1 family)
VRPSTTRSLAVAAPLVGLAVHAAPALTARGPLRRMLPRLAGQGAPGGVALTFDDGPDPRGTPAVLAELGRLLAVGAPAAGLVAVHGAPALTARGVLRRGRLAGEGLPGGVALTFDDGPDPHGTPAVLAALAELGWTATFFLLGSQTRLYPEVARAVVAAGHEIGVHGDEHRNHLTRTAGAVRGDLERAVATITEATGLRPHWFRPPYGVLSAGSLRAAAALDLAPVLWSAWGRDWERTTPERIRDRLLAGVRPGATLLLHDSDCTSTPGSWVATAAALPLLARELDDRGLAVRPLGAHLARRP